MAEPTKVKVNWKSRAQHAERRQEHHEREANEAHRRYEALAAELSGLCDDVLGVEDSTIYGNIRPPTSPLPVRMRRAFKLLLEQKTEIDRIRETLARATDLIWPTPEVEKGIPTCQF